MPSAASTASTRPLRDDGALPDVETSEGAHDLERGFDIARILSGWRLSAELAFLGQELRRHIACAMHTIALLLEEAYDARQHMVVAALGQAQQERQCLDGADIEPDIAEVGTVHAADNHEILASMALEGCEQLADFAPFDPGVGKAFDLLVRLAPDRHDVDRHTMGDSKLGENAG